MAKQAKLLIKTTRILCSNLEGFTFIKNTEGVPGNVCFTTVCIVHTENNNVQINYKVEAFERTNLDYDIIYTTNYDIAVAKYNELAIKWNAYRDM